MHLLRQREIFNHDNNLTLRVRAKCFIYVVGLLRISDTKPRVLSPLACDVEHSPRLRRFEALLRCVLARGSVYESLAKTNVGLAIYCSSRSVASKFSCQHSLFWRSRGPGRHIMTQRAPTFTIGSSSTRRFSGAPRTAYAGALGAGIFRAFPRNISNSPRKLFRRGGGVAHVPTQS